MHFEPRRLHEKDFVKVHQTLIKFYRQRPDEYGLMERTEDAYIEYAELIFKFCKNKKNTILDVGCGSWRSPESIGKYGYAKVNGLDYFSKEKLIEYKSKLTLNNVELVSYEDENVIPFPDNYFDIVASLCVLEHIVEVEKMLTEMHRVLKPGGKFIIRCPNWSGINISINAILHILKNKDRYWRLNNISSSISYLIRTIYWWIELFFKSEPKFIMIYPRMKNGEIIFERSDDDAVHLCHPLTFKKFFRKMGYKIIMFNREAGTTTYSKFFNKIFPSMATTNTIIVEKKFL